MIPKLSVPILASILVLGVLVVGLSFDDAFAQEERVPDWIKNIAIWWGEGLTSETEFLNGIEWLINNGIIEAEATSSDPEIEQLQIYINRLELYLNKISFMLGQQEVDIEKDPSSVGLPRLGSSFANCIDGQVMQGFTMGRISCTEIAGGDGNDGVGIPELPCDGCVDEQSIAANSISTSKIIDQSIGTADIQRNSISGALITDGSLEFVDIAQNGCTTNQIMVWDGNAWICSDGTDTIIKTPIIIQKTITIESGFTGVAKAQCPAGTVVTGGGYYAGGYDAGNRDFTVYRSFPDGSSWYAVARHNTGSGTISLNAYAICLPQ